MTWMWIPSGRARTTGTGMWMLVPSQGTSSWAGASSTSCVGAAGDGVVVSPAEAWAVVRADDAADEDAPGDTRPVGEQPTTTPASRTAGRRPVTRLRVTSRKRGSAGP